MDFDAITQGLETYVAEIEASEGQDKLVYLFEELAFMCHCHGKLDEAQRYYLRSLSCREYNFGLISPDCLPTLHRLGVVYRIQNKFELSELFYNRALLLTRVHLGDKHIDVATRYNYLSGLYLAWGKYEKSKQFIDLSISLYRELMGEDHIFVAFCLIALSFVQVKQGEKQKAQICLYVADSIIQPILLLELAPSKASLPVLICSLALIYMRQSRYSEAEILFRYAMIQQAQDIWPTHPSVGDELGKLAQLYRSRGRERAAEFLFGESKRIQSRNISLEDKESLKTLAFLTDEKEEFIESDLKKENLLKVLKMELEKNSV